MKLGEGIRLLNTTLEALLEPLTEETPGEGDAEPTPAVINDLIIGPKVRGTPDLPYLKVTYGPIKADYRTMGSIGNLEAWVLELRTAAVVKENDTPIDGLARAVDIVSDARDLILSGRRLGIPSLVRTVESRQIDVVPYPFGKKETLYGAGLIYDVTFILK